jgi:hypothetical protein
MTQDESQEPVGWVEAHKGGVMHDLYMPVAEKLPEGVRFDIYTHPPQRTLVAREMTSREISDRNVSKFLGEAPPAQRIWVGLTEQQRNAIEDACEMIIGKPAFDAIDKQLQENNT